MGGATLSAAMPMRQLSEKHCRIEKQSDNAVSGVFRHLRHRPCPPSPNAGRRGRQATHSEAILDRPASCARVAGEAGDQAGVARADEQLVEVIAIEGVAHPCVPSRLCAERG